MSDGGDQPKVKKRKTEKGPSSAAPASVAATSFQPNVKQEKRYTRHQKLDVTKVENKRRRRHVEKQQRLNDEAVRRLAANELLLTEEAGLLEVDGLRGERTCDVTQADLLRNLELDARRRAVNLSLSYGPYSIDYTPNGRHLLLGGRKGGLSVIDTLSLSVVTETNVEETVRDACFLHSSRMFAVAQKKYLHIYDDNAVELHCLRDQQRVNCLEFLPYHFLLVSGTDMGKIHYLDISTGIAPRSIATLKGPVLGMSQNRRTGVISTGHRSGVVGLWTPNDSRPAAEFLAHGGAISALEHCGEHYFVSAGVDNTVRFWDLRKFEEIRSPIKTTTFPATSLSWSQTGLLAVGYGHTVEIYKGAFDSSSLRRDESQSNLSNTGILKAGTRSGLYVRHRFAPHRSTALVSTARKDMSSAATLINKFQFKPFDDILGVGTNCGFSTLLVPGAGFANYDSRAANPYETASQRKEREIHSLLEKLPPTSITFSVKSSPAIAK